MPLKFKKLPLCFYNNDTEKVARELLGKKLVRVLNNKRLSGIIVETEAYLGSTDQACHSRNGIKTKRNASMYLPGGHAYVYFIYGMYFCLNAVTKSSKNAEAVLIRAIEPVEGIELMRKFKNSSKQDLHLTNGPGKLAQSLMIDKTLDGESLKGNNLFIEETGITYKKNEIIKTSRIGISKTNEACDWQLRFYVKDCPYVSKK